MGKYLIATLISTFLILGAAFQAGASELLERVESEKVCMVTDMHFPKKQIPVTHSGKTYYGCCANCKETLAKDAKARTAVDPISGKPVDKAVAVIGRRDDHSVVYFENENNFNKYVKNSVKKPGSSGPSDHSHH